MSGTLFLIVGASGVGKDTLIDLLKCRFPNICFPRRYITRPAGKGGEDYVSVSEEIFEKMISDDEFCVHWQAHGLHYGAHSNIRRTVEDGRNVVLNTSRSVIPLFESQFPRTVVIEITADKESLRERLLERARESAVDIEARLAREAPQICCRVLEQIDNSTDISTAFAALEKVVIKQTEAA